MAKVKSYLPENLEAKIQQNVEWAKEKIPENWDEKFQKITNKIAKVEEIAKEYIPESESSEIAEIIENITQKMEAVKESAEQVPAILEKLRVELVDIVRTAERIFGGLDYFVNGDQTEKDQADEGLYILVNFVGALVNDPSFESLGNIHIMVGENTDKYTTLVSQSMESVETRVEDLHHSVERYMDKILEHVPADFQNQVQNHIIELHMLIQWLKYDITIPANLFRWEAEKRVYQFHLLIDSNKDKIKERALGLDKLNQKLFQKIKEQYLKSEE